MSEIDAILPLLNQIRIPTAKDKIYKDECVYSFDTPDSPDGIYVCLKTFLGFGKKFVQLHHEKTGNSVYLNLRRIAHPVQKTHEAEECKQKITKLALNVEGGFNTGDKKFEYEEVNKIVILPQFREIPLNLPDLPDSVIMSVSGILAADSASRLAEIESMQGTWDGEVRLPTKHADSLLQLDNGVRVPPSGWKCCKCDIREGLWLNMTDGTILCGRKYFDGSGGNNHASEHYKETKYPLAVKLGTITPTGADLYSYDEDSMVTDPYLDKHLAHFGINIANMQKTEKSMVELEIDLNQKYDEWSIIQEDGCELKSLFGPGFTGLTNLGNSCYLNSIMQMVFSIPDFVERYHIVDKVQQFNNSNNRDPAGDLKTQLQKLASGLLSGEYSLCGPNMKEQLGIKPQMFKNLIGRNHPEFMSKRQQDAQEFFLHVIDLIERLHSGGDQTARGPPPTDCFKFQVEERVECGESKKVKYNNRSEYFLSLPISSVPIQNREQYEEFVKHKAAVELAGSKIESKDIIRQQIKMTDCIQNFANKVVIEDFYSAAINRKTFATMTTRFRTFPDYLIIHLKKFTLGEDWIPKKLDVELDVPDVLDLEFLRGKGKQPNEEELPESAPTTPTTSSATSAFAVDSAAVPAAVPFEFDQSQLAQLKEMGFSVEGCKRALFATKNGGVETAMNWVFEHMNDSDFNTTFVLPGSGSSSAQQSANNPQQQASSGLDSVNDVVVDNEALGNITSMGIEDRHARLALKLNNNNTERSIEWIFANIENIDKIEQELLQKQRAASVAASAQQKVFRDGSGKYELVALISHMGTSTFCGHYVCHIKKEIQNQDGSGSSCWQWTIFNDNKVAISERPPKPYAYMYLYKRIKQ